MSAREPESSSTGSAGFASRTSVDVTAADSIAELDDGLRGDGIELAFAEMKDPVKDKLKRFGLFARFGAESFYPTVGEAVKAYLQAHPVPYQDWEDEAARPVTREDS